MSRTTVLGELMTRSGTWGLSSYYAVRYESIFILVPRLKLTSISPWS